MYQKRRSSSRSYPVSRHYVTQRANHGYFAALTRFLTDLLIGMVLILCAVLCVVLLFALLTHLPQVEASGTQALAWIATYGPVVALLAGIVAGIFVVLGIVYGMVKVITMISETLSSASFARAKARQEWAKEERYRLSAQTCPIPKLRLRGSATRHALGW